ncbi:DNA-dependent metalloprotease WSS1 homolog [Trichoderma asperellum]|uniref:DNA-dependent metalloprotease WSS1 homolog n=1 Tax=Trichoderma asperellum TaxID=101201 RepID=A0A6V8QK20_TRIAP|nr:DNA-dependent metalloprotease WSS1 homolog [Trichoderma asperellum]
MPIGIQRLNAKKSQPNPHIVFIKPLKGPDENIAQDFLERIAAQCLPVMRKHHIHVMSLEEFPPNREFVGRNFNAGEVIQLVLKSPGSGRWLPFNYVQMVMMHELAHCAQMNHSRAFWAVRNQYAAQMQALWAEGYKGDGLWGRGAKLATGEWERNSVMADEVLPEHLCGGTYRSRGRKRKAKPVLTYQERKERRILKKFGKNGIALGADEEEKVKLEKGKRVQAKPRVASSLRGRELRAAAALARFEQSKDDAAKKEEEEEEGLSDYEDGDLTDSKPAVDLDGTRMTDKDGSDMVKVCEDEDPDDADARNEFDELQGLFGRRKIKLEAGTERLNLHPSRSLDPERTVKHEEGEREPAIKPEVAADDDGASSRNLSSIPHVKPAPSKTIIKPEPESNTTGRQALLKSISTPTTPTTVNTQESSGSRTAPTDCSMCSFANPASAVTCAMCANVLDPKHTTGSWQCKSASCVATAYRNARDCGVCGLCGQRRGME